MRLIAFITEGPQIRRILDHIGVYSEPPHISPERGPPLWDDCDAQMHDGAQSSRQTAAGLGPAADENLPKITLFANKSIVSSYKI